MRPADKKICLGFFIKTNQQGWIETFLPSLRFPLLLNLRLHPHSLDLSVWKATDSLLNVA